MVKIYISTMKGLVVSGISFYSRQVGNGSYYATSSEEEQRELESSPFFGKLFKLRKERKVEEEKAEEKVEERKEETGDVYTTSKLQEAREIIAKVREERGLEVRGMTNKQSVLNAAKELGLKFPNIKK